MIFSEIILTWYEKHRRDLPWRQTKNPYLIWLSEIILQQTRVDQGTAYYLKFADHYPTVKDLADASEDEVMKDWQGLGYYSRARNLHAAAKNIAYERKGEFPETAKGWREIKGVGPYTAAAIASFAFNEVTPVVDGNVYRVLARVFGVDTPIDSTAGKKEFQALAEELISHQHPADYNQAIMEFGALQCVPKSPNCNQCPAADMCEAKRSQRITELPVKAKKTKVRERYFQYLVLRFRDGVVLEKRSGKGIWQNLYQFPLIESDQVISPDELLTSETLLKWKGKSEWKLISQSPEHLHILSHQKLRTHFWEIEVEEDWQPEAGFIPVSWEELEKYAIPRLIDRYLQSRLDPQQGLLF